MCDGDILPPICAFKPKWYSSIYNFGLYTYYYYYYYYLCYNGTILTQYSVCIMIRRETKDIAAKGATPAVVYLTLLLFTYQTSLQGCTHVHVANKPITRQIDIGLQNLYLIIIDKFSVLVCIEWISLILFVIN